MINQPSGLINLASSLNQSRSGRIMVVDDYIFSRMTVVDLLSIDNYEVIEVESTEPVLELAIQQQPDLILLDLSTPQLNGLELCAVIKQHPQTQLIPIILISVRGDRPMRLQCIEAGGDELMTKPIDRIELTARVKSLIKRKRLNEGLDQTEQVLFSLAQAIEGRFSDGDSSCARLAALAKDFGQYLRLSPSELQDLMYAAHLHDIGTVAIPDSILLKKGELTAAEKQLVRQHVLVGEKICQPMRNRPGVLPIIRHHHERWNGSGYPDGLKGEEIPYLAQVFQILDIYEALTGIRPHKQAFTPTQALDILNAEAEKGWRNPDLVEQFNRFVG